MTVIKEYVPLRVRSHYSLLEGLSKPYQIANRCSKIGVKSCALTDRSTISGSVEFYQSLKKKNIKPILGCELYITNNDPKIKTPENSNLSHLLILAKNHNGWKKLIQIVSEANKPEHFLDKPRINLEILSKFLDGNLIGFSGTLGSLLGNLLSTSKDSIEKTGIEFVSKMKDMFGKDNFFLESQLINREYLDDQIEITDHIRRLAKITSTKIVCTPDAYYCEKEDAVDQRVLLCNNLKTTFTDINRRMLNNEKVPMDDFFRSDNFNILCSEEMTNIYTAEEIENTIYVDTLCEEYDIANKPLLPEFKCNINPDEYLRQLCRNGWRQKIENNLPKEKHQIYIDRIKYELDVLQGAGLSNYFLIVQDIVNYVKNNNWLAGPGRGSAAGCLVSYLIGITSIDPVRYDLIFERFYNAGRNTSDRISLPDIDVDVPINKRENIIDYIKQKYGQNKVSQMITYNTMKGRGALKEVLRVYGNISFDEMNRITKYIPDEAKIADELQEMKDATGESSIIKWALENNVDKLKEWCYITDNAELAGPLSKRFEQAIRLEGTKSNQSKHAAGVVISSHDLYSVCPMIYDSKNKQSIAGMEMKDLDYLGVPKFDILGVAMFDKIMNINNLLKNGE